MDKSSSTDDDPRVRHAITIAIIAAIKAGFEFIVADAERLNQPELLTESACVIRLCEDPGAMKPMNDAYEASVISSGFFGIDTKFGGCVTNKDGNKSDQQKNKKAVGYSKGEVCDDLEAVAWLNGVAYKYSLNHKREDPKNASGTGTKSRVAKSGAVCRLTLGVDIPRNKSAGPTILEVIGDPTAVTFGWGVVALVGPLGNVQVYVYDVPAVVATTPSIKLNAKDKGNADRVIVPGFNAAAHPDICSIYGPEDCVLQMNHRLAEAHWLALAPRLVQSGAVTRNVFTLVALKRAITVYEAFLNGEVASCRESLGILGEISAFYAAGLLV